MMMTATAPVRRILFRERSIIFKIIACTTLDTNCLECSNDLYCSSCDNGLLISGPNCVATCPSGTTNNDGICTSNH